MLRFALAARVPAFAVAMALHAIPASAAHFTYTAVVMSYNNVTATGIYGNQIVGNAQPYGSNSYEGFVWSNGSVTDIPSTFGIVGVSDNGLAVGTAVENATSYVAYNIPSGQATTIAYAGSPAISIYALGINAPGTVTGEVHEPNAHHPKRFLYQGFEQDSAGSVALLGKPQLYAYAPFPIGIADDGRTVLVALSSHDTGPNVFISRPNGSLKPYKVHGGTHVEILWANGAGAFGGDYKKSDNALVGFVSKGGPPANYMVPSAKQSWVVGVGPHGEVVGNFIDSKDRFHGFVFFKGTYNVIDYPRAAGTVLKYVSTTGSVAGLYLNRDEGGYPSHLFLADCPTGSVCDK